MAKVFFNPLNYWLMVTALLVVVDRMAGEKLYFVLAGVAAFAAAFAASVSLGLVWQVSVFFVVVALLFKFARKPLLRIRNESLESIEEAIDWYKGMKGVVLVETSSTRPGRVVFDETLVFSARSGKKLRPGFVVDFDSMHLGEIWVKSSKECDEG